MSTAATGRISLEGLRLLEERVATAAQIDRIARLEGGFRMGPFELMDLIGIETNHAVAESLYRASFGEPRYRPSALQARMVAAGRLGRKTGRGWYEYGDGSARAEDPEPSQRAGGDGRAVAVLGSLPVAGLLAAAAAEAGFAVVTEATDDAWLTLVCGSGFQVPGRRARLLYDGSLSERDPQAAGFHVVAPLGRLLEVTATPRSDPESVSRLAEFGAALGMVVERVGDAPGLVMGRVVAQLINEAALLIGAGNGTPSDVDAGLTLGVNHPRGPIAWAAALGAEHVVTLLDALRRERGEKYLVAPLLRAGGLTPP